VKTCFGNRPPKLRKACPFLGNAYLFYKAVNAGVFSDVISRLSRA
jgi:hypothetical protein